MSAKKKIKRKKERKNYIPISICRQFVISIIISNYMWNEKGNVSACCSRGQTHWTDLEISKCER